HDVITFLEESDILDQGLTDVERVVKELQKKSPKGEPYDTELLSQNGDAALKVLVIERKTGLATTHTMSRDLFSSHEDRQLARVHGELLKLIGAPTIKLKLEKGVEEAVSFEELRKKVLELAKHGIQLHQFK